MKSPPPVSPGAPLKRRFAKRCLAHAFAFFLLWPLSTVLASTLILQSEAMTARLSWTNTFVILFQSLQLLAAEFAGAALLGCALSVLLFTALDSALAAQTSTRFGWLLLEVILLALSGIVGVSAEFPAVLAHPFFAVFRKVVFLAAFLLLVSAVALLAGAMGFRAGRAKGALLWGVSLGSVALFSWLFVRSRPRLLDKQASAGTVVVLGLDSLSQADDLSRLKRFTLEKGGAWYENAVSPALFTNPVWTSVLLHRPMREAGIWEIFQTRNWETPPFNLVLQAHRAGYTTYSYFSDQFTTYVGTEARFDHDRSGPLGWHQLATATLKNGSVWLPLLLPRLPRLPGAHSPRNQSGTYAFDLETELTRIFSTRAPAGRAFAAGHIDYLHQPQYPRFSVLSSEEKRTVWRSPAEALVDSSLDWQFPEVPGDRLGLYKWKIRHLQSVVEETLVETRFLDPGKGNRLVLFSDHGNRRGLSEENFWNSGYWKVLFATFGVPARDTKTPISLLEIPALTGFPDATRPGEARPSLQFTGINEQESKAMSSALFLTDGRILTSPDITIEIGKRIREYRPYSDPLRIYLTPIR